MVTFFHGSEQDFSEFDLFSAGRGTGATNGALGIWLTTHQNIASSFGSGGFVYEVDLQDGPVYTMPLAVLSKLHHRAREMSDEEAITLYKTIRSELLDQGYVRIDILEDDGSTPTLVCLDPNFAKITAKHSLSACHGPAL